MGYTFTTLSQKLVYVLDSWLTPEVEDVSYVQTSIKVIPINLSIGYSQKMLLSI